MKRKIETEISFAEMIQAIRSTKGEVGSPVSIFDGTCLFSAENYDQILRIMSTVASLKRNETIDFLEHDRLREKYIASISIDKLWFSMPLIASSEREVQKAFFENVSSKVWHGACEVTVGTKSHGSCAKLPEMRFCIGKNELEVGVMVDNEGYDLYVSKGLDTPAKNSESFIKLPKLRNVISMIEKVMTPEGLIAIDTARDNADNRREKIERTDIFITYHLNNNQKTKLAGLCLKEGKTFMIF